MRGTIIPKTNTNTIEPTDDNNELLHIIGIFVKKSSRYCYLYTK
jgi:hypothetical protein